MSVKENPRELADTLEYLNEESVFSRDVPRGEVVLDILRQKNLNPQRKGAALIFKTLVLIGQNPPRKSSGS